MASAQNHPRDFVNNRGDETGKNRDEIGPIQLGMNDFRFRNAEPLTIDDQEARLKAEQELDRLQAIQQLGQMGGRRYRRENVSLDKFDLYAQPDAQKSALEQVRFVASKIKAMSADGRGVMFWGAVGTGKDRLMAWLLYQAIDHGLSVKWINGMEVFGRLHDNMDAGKRDEGFLSELCQPQILAISDPIPPVGSLGAWDTRSLYRIIDRRYRNLLPTWASVNVKDDADADAKMSEPVFDRLRDHAVIVKCFWPSWRGKQ